MAMGSLDLTAAFDVVNVDLLMKRLIILGLPSDWLDLLGAWLRDRAAFVEVLADRSMLFDVNIGTVQGSILGPVLFSLFIAPVFGRFLSMRMIPIQLHHQEKNKMLWRN